MEDDAPCCSHQSESAATGPSSAAADRPLSGGRSTTGLSRGPQPAITTSQSLRRRQQPEQRTAADYSMNKRTRWKRRPASDTLNTYSRTAAALYGLVLFTVLLQCCQAAVSPRKAYTNTWAVQIHDGKASTADAIAHKYGYVNLGQVFDDFYLFGSARVRKRSIRHSRATQVQLARDPQVDWLEQQVAKRRVKRGHNAERRGRRQHQQQHPNLITGLPSSPASSLLSSVNVSQRTVFTYGEGHNHLLTHGKPNDAFWPYMWYLHRPGPGLDHNVKSAWDQGFTGKNVVVTILDDGLEHTHPDIRDNYDPLASFDVNGHDEDPTPRYDDRGENRHGTRCAGEVAAVYNNTLCIVGIAFNSRIGAEEVRREYKWHQLLDQHVKTRDNSSPPKSPRYCRDEDKENTPPRPPPPPPTGQRAAQQSMRPTPARKHFGYRQAYTPQPQRPTTPVSRPDQPHHAPPPTRRNLSVVFSQLGQTLNSRDGAVNWQPINPTGEQSSVPERTTSSPSLGAASYAAQDTARKQQQELYCRRVQLSRARTEVNCLQREKDEALKQLEAKDKEITELKSDQKEAADHHRKKFAVARIQLHISELSHQVRELSNYVDFDSPSAQHSIRAIWAKLFAAQQQVHQLQPPTATQPKKDCWK